MNAWQQVDHIASESLMHLEDRIVIGKLAAKDITAEFNKTPNGYAKGDTITMKTRPDFVAKEFGGNTETQEIRESKRSLTVEKHLDVTIAITAKEKAMDLDSLVEQVIRPASYRLAEKADAYIGTKILNAAGMYASDDLFATAGDMALARRSSNYQQMEPDGRFCLLNPDMEARLIGNDWFNTHDNRGQTGEAILNSGSMGKTLGFEFYSSEQFPDKVYATVGNGTTTTDGGTAVAGVFPNNKIGFTALTIDALTGTISDGARIRIAGVRRPLIVNGAVAAGATTINLVDPITEIIPDGAAVTVVGSGQTNLTVQGAMFDSQSIAIASPVLDPASDKPTFVVSNNGYSLRVVQGYDMDTKTEQLSIDMLIGAEAHDHRKIQLLTEY